MIEAAGNETRWRTVAKQMVHAWNEGHVPLRDPRRSVAVRGLDAAICGGRILDPEPPERSRVTIGRSELLAPRLKALLRSSIPLRVVSDAARCAFASRGTAAAIPAAHGLAPPGVAGHGLRP